MKNVSNDTQHESEKNKKNGLIEKNKWIGIGIIAPETIDEINILNAALKAMALSYEKVNNTIKVDKLMVDGNRSPRKFIDNGSLEIETVVKGDSKIYEIMAASILAKTARDRFMDELDKKYPLYNFKKNKGYPSKEHQEAIIKYGLTPCHRKSFHLKNVIIKEEQDLLPL